MTSVRSSPLAALRDAQLRRLFAAQVTSALGHSALWLCAGIWVQQLTGSNGSAALTFFFFLAPALLAPVAGAVVDRLPRRSFLVCTNIVGAVGLLPLLTVHTSAQAPVIYAVMSFYGLITVSTGPAQSALIAESAPTSELAAMNGLMRSAVEASKLIAPAAGAGLFAFAGPRVVVVLDVLAFLVAAWLLYRLPRRPAPEPTHLRESVTLQLTGGFRYLFQVRALRSLVLVCILFMAGAGLNEALRWAVVTQGLHAAAEWIGGLQTVMGVGSVLVGLTASTVISRYGELNAAALSLATFGLGCALWTSPVPALIVVGALLVGGGATLLVVAAITMLQTRAAANMQGRAFAAFDLLTTAPQVASVALGARLVEVVDYRLTLLALTAVALTSAALAALYARTVPSTIPPPEDSMHEVTWSQTELANLTEWPPAPRLLTPQDQMALDAQGCLSLLDDPRFVARRVSVVRDGTPVPRREFITAQRVDRSKVEELFAQGATVTFREMHEWFEPVQHVARGLQDLTGHPVQANAYLTPAGQQGFAHHWDTHTAVVQQLQGSKTWQLYAPCVTDPVDPDHLFTRLGFGPEVERRLREQDPDLTVTLSRGQWLWVPRGWIHNPFAPAGDEPSLHVTYGVLEVTTLAVISAMVAAMSAEEEFRVARPPHAALPSEQEVADLRDRVVRWLDAATTEDLHPAIRTRLLQ